MKKISLVLALVFSVLISIAQTWTNVNGRWGYEWLRAPKALFIPSGNGAPSGTSSLNGALYKGQAALYSDTTNKKLYLFNAKDSTWTDVTAGAGIVGPTMGGTGLTTVTTGDMLYGSATNTWARLPGVATGNALISGGVGTAFAWGKIGLASHVSGILPIANGGTGTSTPGLVQGTNITITGAWPNQTINSSGGGGGSQGITSVLTVGQVDTNKTIQFGYPQAGFFQNQQNTPTDTIWEGAPMTGYPFRGSDTGITMPRVFTFFSMRTHRYDVTKEPNVIMNVATAGSEGIGNAFMRIGGLEWHWYDNYEYHPIEMKPISFASAIRMQSVTMNRLSGLSTWTQRGTLHVFSDISDNQMLNLSRTASTLTASGTAQPTLRFLTQSTDATNGGLTMATESGQTIFNFHPSSGSFHLNQLDFPYSTIIGSARTVNSSDPEIRFQGAGRLANNRIWEWTNGAQGFLMVMNVDSDGLPSLNVGGNNFMANGSVSLMAKSLRNRHQKPFAVGISSNSADTFYHKIPLAFDTLGRGVVNLPDPNNAIKDGLLGLSAYAYDWRVFGKSAVVDNTAGFNRLLTLMNTDGASFSGPELRLFNNVGVGSTNGFSIGMYSNGTAAPYTNAGVLQNKEGGPLVMYGASAEIARFTDAGEVQIGSTSDLGSSKLQVTGTIQMQDGNQAAGKVFTSDANGVGTWQAPATGANYAIDKQYTNTQNSGSSATDMFTKTIAANQLSADGNELQFETSGFEVDATTTMDLSMVFNGTSIGSTSPLTLAGTTNWVIKGTIIRTSSSTMRSVMTISVDDGTSRNTYINSAVMSSLDFTSTIILKLVATAGGAGASTGDIIGHLWHVDFKQ
jgi:hypothetical protein